MKRRIIVKILGILIFPTIWASGIIWVAIQRNQFTTDFWVFLFTTVSVFIVFSGMMWEMGKYFDEREEKEKQVRNKQPK